jgi:hypothetical protein
VKSSLQFPESPNTANRKLVNGTTRFRYWLLTDETPIIASDDFRDGELDSSVSELEVVCKYH